MRKLLLSTLIFNLYFRTNKSHILTGHAKTLENGYERFYDFEKRESEKYTVLCFNKDFEIVNYGDITDGKS